MKRPCIPLDSECYATHFFEALKAIHNHRCDHRATQKIVILALMKSKYHLLQAKTDDGGKIESLVQKGVLNVTKAGKFAVARRYW